MKIYNVKVNGKKYRVELESIEEVKSAAPKADAPVAAAPVEAKPAILTTGGEGQAVVSPIQGTVVNVKVKVGDKVKKGDVVVVVEAMKLENDVVSTFDGIVSEVCVNKGASVTAKQPLVIVK